MDFDYNHFANPSDQFHIPHTPFVMQNSAPFSPGAKSNMVEGMSGESYNFLNKMNTGLMANNQINSNVGILDPQAFSDNGALNANLYYGLNRSPGKFIPDQILEDQIRRDIGRKIDGVALTNANMGPAYLSAPIGTTTPSIYTGVNPAYQYPMNVNDANRVYYMNSDGRGSARGPLKNGTLFDGYNPYVNGKVYITNNRRENYENNLDSDSSSDSGTDSDSDEYELDVNELDQNSIRRKSRDKYMREGFSHKRKSKCRRCKKKSNCMENKLFLLILFFVVALVMCQSHAENKNITYTNKFPFVKEKTDVPN